MYTLFITIHVIASLLLITSILLQAGRGGGLSEMFGGSSTQTIFGTSATDFLKKATTVSAIVFLSTSLILAVLSSKRSKSLMDRVKVMPMQGMEIPVPATADVAPEPAAEQNEAEE